MGHTILSLMMDLGIVSSFVWVCESTGLSWGYNPRELYFYRPPEFQLWEQLWLNLFVYIVWRFGCRGYLSNLLAVPMPSQERLLPKGAAGWGFTMEKVFGVFWLACWLVQLALKANRKQWMMQVWWMCMPCHVITAVWAFIYLCGRRYPAWAFYLGSICTACHWGPLSAVMFPDFGDHELLLETIYFYVHHGTLSIAPLIFLARFGGLRPSYTFIMNVTAVATFINISIYTPVSFISGLNINYHLSPPPPLMKVPIFQSIYYRYIVIAGLVVLTTIMYPIQWAMGGVIRRIFGWESVSYERYVTKMDAQYAHLPGFTPPTATTKKKSE